MELLDRYLDAVKPHLPRQQRNDILQDLKEYGHPMLVAGRYRQNGGSLAFGRQWIGPELFPLYVKLLCLNLGIAAAIFIAFLLTTGRLPSMSQFLFLASVQFACVTLLFILADRWERRSHHWSTMAAHLQPIPRWQSVTGLGVWSVFVLWMVAAPVFPYLIFGPAAAHLKLVSGWTMFYVPVLLLLLAGLAQRWLNLVHPDRTWLLPATRLAEIFNAAMVRGLAGYLLLNAMIHACICVPHFRRWKAGRAA